MNKAKDQWLIEHPFDWPRNPFLPVKRGDVWKGGEFGVIHALNLKTVVLCNLYDMPPTSKEFNALPRMTYQSVEELLADGWIVD